MGLQTLPSVCWVPLAVLVLGLNERGILFVITAEVYPLFKSPTATPLTALDTAVVPAGRSAAGVDEYREIAYTVTPAGVLQVTRLRAAGSYPPVPVAGLEGALVTTVIERPA